jgi:Amt family ammonium transporter
MLLMYAVKATGTLRVSRQGELEGLDVHEHGGSAYPELTGGIHGIPAAPEPEPVPAPALAEVQA